MLNVKRDCGNLVRRERRPLKVRGALGLPKCIFNFLGLWEGDIFFIGHFLEQLVVVSSVCRGLAGINILGSACDRMGARLKVFDESESFSVHILSFV